MSEAIIGVLGTLLGTLLGWILGRYDKKGKISIYFFNIKESFKNKTYGRSGDRDSKTIEGTNYYEIDFYMDIYNSSAETRIMRNITIAIHNGERIIFQDRLSDRDDRINKTAYYTYGKIESINVPPKTILNYHLFESFSSIEMNPIFKAKELRLLYQDEKNKTHSITIKKEDYSHHFDNQEDTQNGQT